MRIETIKTLLPYCYQLKPAILKLSKLIYPVPDANKNNLIIYYVFQLPIAIAIDKQLHVDTMAWTRRRKLRSKQVSVIIKDITYDRGIVNISLKTRQELLATFVTELTNNKLIYAPSAISPGTTNTRRIKL